MCVLFPRIACFRIEDDEELAGERDGDAHQRLSGIAQPLVECLEPVMEAGRSSGDEEHDGPDRAMSTTGDAASLALAAVIGLRREAQELGKSLAMALPLQVPISGKSPSGLRRCDLRRPPKCYCDARTERMRPS
jgi:hypothetical protein